MLRKMVPDWKNDPHIEVVGESILYNFEEERLVPKRISLDGSPEWHKAKASAVFTVSSSRCTGQDAAWDEVDTVLRNFGDVEVLVLESKSHIDSGFHQTWLDVVVSKRVP